MPSEGLTIFMEIQNTIACLESALRVMYTGGIGTAGLPGALEMAEYHLKFAQKMVHDVGTWKLEAEAEKGKAVD